MDMNQVFLHNDKAGSYACLERGEIPLGPQFFEGFEREGRHYGLQ
jgi:hypothetical protein